MRLWLVALVVMAMTIPVSYASLCSRAGSSQGDCDAVMASGLDNEEKRETLGALLAGDSWKPNHESALAWNRMILDEETSPPDTKSQGSIHNAWVELLGLHPSLQERDALYHSGEGTALLASDYNIVPHAGTLSGDCSTVYRPQPVSAAVSLLINGVQQGTGSEVVYTGSGDATFTAQLSVSQTTYVDRYKNYPYCCLWKTGCGLWSCWRYCLSWCPNCKYESSETWHNSVLVTDSLDAKLYSYLPTATFTPIDQYSGTVKVVFSPDETANTYLKVGDDLNAVQATVYSSVVSEPPFETLTVTATPEETEDDITMLLVAGQECELEVVAHFGSQQFPCLTEYTGPRLRVSTDKIFYKAGETIDVTVTGTDEDVTLDYGGQMHGDPEGEGFSLKAVPDFNRITGFTTGQHDSVTIGVVNPELWRVLVKILMLMLMVGATFSGVRNWARRRGLWDAA